MHYHNAKVAAKRLLLVNPFASGVPRSCEVNWLINQDQGFLLLQDGLLVRLLLFGPGVVLRLFISATSLKYFLVGSLDQLRG